MNLEVVNLVAKMQWRKQIVTNKDKVDFDIAWYELNSGLPQSIVMIWGMETDIDLISSIAKSSGKAASSREAERSSSLATSSTLAASLLTMTTVSASLRSKRKR